MPAEMTLTELRQQVQQVMTDIGLVGYDHVPSPLYPPFAVVTYGSPMLEKGDTFCTHRVHLDVTVVVAPSTNESETDALDEAVTKALFALQEARFTVERVEEPLISGSETVTQSLGTTLSISTEIKIKGY